MAANTQFSIAVHLMIALGYDCGQQKTSTQLASSINTSPSFVRRILAKLSKADLVCTSTGKFGSCCLIKKPEDISLLEIYTAVQAPKAFTIHNYPVQGNCRISCNIADTMSHVLTRAQNSFENTLKKTSLAEVIADIKNS